ncbi:hypothetical protein LSH36_448g00001 [Paralvinella palmiformis]|uniref:Uncharacterized protein n=1 Tax=Paralvinella palmiformis TaxID=53620 RepID=A0AAD9N092_9ANNE|nr:hypothetical protein LSH36_448g00001 [Paralvinella palmiformis]
MENGTFTRSPNWEYLMHFLTPRSTKGASKQRRDLINAEIAVLRDLLPLPEPTRQRLSQLQIMSLACVYIRKCNFFSRPDIHKSNIPASANTFLGNRLLAILAEQHYFLLFPGNDRFLVGCLKRWKTAVYLRECHGIPWPFDGNPPPHSPDIISIVYQRHAQQMRCDLTNPNALSSLIQVDMMTQGDSIYDIIDKRDHQLVQKQLMQEGYPPQTAEGSAKPESLPKNERAFFCRMNMMYVKGHFVTPSVRDHYGNQPVFIAVCTPLITPDVKDTTIQNSTQTFYSVHGLDMKYTELGHIGQYQLGYTEGEIIDKSWYELLHPEDILEAKEKHVQLIKSSHEMGCVLTARLQHKAGHWVWMNIVMHVRQPFVCDNDEPAIVCINQVIDDGEARQFRTQSQMYSSQIARSPEFLGSRDAASGAPHTITQVPVESRPYPSGGCHEGQRTRDDLTYQVNFVAAGRQAISPRSDRSPNPSVASRACSSSLFPDSSSEYSSSSSSESETKQALRADIINRLKRKMSESAANCKPKKIQRFGDANARSASGSDAMVGLRGTTSLVGNPLLLESVGGVVPIGNGSVQVLATAREAPIYQQLSLKKDLLLDRQEMLTKIEPTVPLFHEAVKPPTPLTPDSLTSDLMADFQTDILRVDVTDSAVVPVSMLTPDASPLSTAAADEVLNSPPPHADPNIEYKAELPTLDDLCFFDEAPPSDKPKNKSPVVLQLSDAGTKELPVIDVVSLETMLHGLDDSSARMQSVADVTSTSLPAGVQPPAVVADQVKLSDNDEQLLNQVTNVLMEIVQQAADGSLDLSQLMLAGQQQPVNSQQPVAMSASTVKSNDGLTTLDGLTQLTSVTMTDEMNFTLDDLTQLTQLDLTASSFGDCDLTSSLLAQNL